MHIKVIHDFASINSIDELFQYIDNCKRDYENSILFANEASSFDVLKNQINTSMLVNKVIHY